MNDPRKKTPYQWTSWLSPVVFMGVFAGHALYLSRIAASPTAGWADGEVMDTGFTGLGSYVQGQDYYLGLSYALGAAFAVWAVGQFLRSRQTAMAAGAVGSVTLVGVLLGAGCFMIGCCGSPMLGVYMGIFGAKALGVGKPLMALVTILSVGFGCWYLSRRSKREICRDSSCVCHSSPTSQPGRSKKK
jgi:hypothetical protein